MTISPADYYLSHGPDLDGPYRLQEEAAVSAVDFAKSQIAAAIEMIQDLAAHSEEKAEELARELSEATQF